MFLRKNRITLSNLPMIRRDFEEWRMLQYIFQNYFSRFINDEFSFSINKHT